MDKLRPALLAHLRKYPLMGPADCVKLIYQNEFGGGHMLVSPRASLESIREELGEAEAAPGEIYEDIGGPARLCFGAAKYAGMGPEEINSAFAASAGRRGNMASFMEKLKLLDGLCRGGLTPFSPGELERFLSDYLKKGCPPPRHSPAYKKAYRPHYRVVGAKGPSRELPCRPACSPFKTST